MKPVLLFITLLAGFFDPPLPDNPVIKKLHYVITQKGKQIGDVYATRSTRDEQVTYDIETHMTVKLLVSQKVSYTSKAEFKDGVLVSSNSRSFVNDKLHHACVTQWKGNRYEIKRDNEASSLARQVGYSGVMLYFKEPAGVGLVYSEMSGHDNSMRKAGDAFYILTDLKNKKQNKYWYKGGILDHAFINHTLVDIEIQRVN